MAFAEPDWTSWKPTERGVICFVLRGGRILLIHKKRGLGAGKVNGPGGRIEPGESAEQAAIRECQEEIGLTPKRLASAGELLFQFTDGYALHCEIFTAKDAEGTLVETEEADPFWTKTSAIPYQDMWADDAYWIPWMLEGRPFRGLFCFEGDQMLSGRVLPR